MRKKTYDSMIKRVHEINDGPLSFPILIKRLAPQELQINYNPLLGEYIQGDPIYEVIEDTTGIFSAFKESEKWIEIGTLSIHDWKCSINDTVFIDTNCIVERKDTGEIFEVIFKRPYIGENIVGLRPVTP